MGLDWHSQIRMTKKERIEWAEENCREELEAGACLEDVLEEEVPRFKKPCAIVGAPKMRERLNFEADVEKVLEMRKKDAREAEENDHPNKTYIEFWKNRTLEEEIEDVADKWDCENCPLLKELQGADSTNSFFIGVTVSSCDFRGKVIGSDDAILSELRESAYDEKDPVEMFDFADELEHELERLRDDGELVKDSYEKYSQEWDESKGPFKDPKLSPEEYEKRMHWREENIKQAIHWLRTCADYGVSMGVSY